MGVTFVREETQALKPVQGGGYGPRAELPCLKLPLHTQPILFSAGKERQGLVLGQLARGSSLERCLVRFRSGQKRAIPIFGAETKKGTPGQRQPDDAVGSLLYGLDTGHFRPIDGMS